MSVPNEQVLMGGMVAALCGLALYYDRWLLEKTSKGQRLTQWLGDDKALWVLRGILSAGVVFGVLLASGIVNPRSRAAAVIGDGRSSLRAPFAIELIVALPPEAKQLRAASGAE